MDQDRKPPLARMNPPTMPDAGAFGYSQITVAAPGRLAFVSGQVALDRGGAPTPPGLEAQTAMVLSNARAALDALGASAQDLVMVRLYVVDLTPARQAMAMPQLMAFLGDARPSLTGIGVAALASPDFQLEMEMVVRLPD